MEVVIVSCALPDFFIPLAGSFTDDARRARDGSMRFATPAVNAFTTLLPVPTFFLGINAAWFRPLPRVALIRIS